MDGRIRAGLILEFDTMKNFRKNIGSKIKPFLKNLRKVVLESVLFLVYFVVISGYALVWRWIMRQGLNKSRGRWTPVRESTGDATLFRKSV